jgi:predicted ATPase
MSDPDAIAYTYSVSAGVTSRATPDAFFHEPQIKEETLSFRYRGRTTKLLERRGPSAFALDREGKRQPLALDLMAAQTALGAFDEPQRFPELHGVQQAMQDWRFYHDFRTDVSAPVRQPCLAVSTLLLASDGANLAAVFATLVYIRQDRAGLDEAIESAFPGARLHVPLPEKMASFGMIFPDHPHRVFEASELSDGTLRFLLLAGALLSSRLPRFIALNEPESSLHPDLLVPLAKLIVSAAKVTQIWLVTHSTVLAEHIRVLGDVRPRTVIKQAGETWIKGLKVTGEYDDEQDDGTADDERDDAGAD